MNILKKFRKQNKAKVKRPRGGSFKGIIHRFKSIDLKSKVRSARIRPSNLRSKMGIKLMIVLLSLSIIPTLVLGIYSYNRVFEEIRTGQIDKYNIYLEGISSSMRNTMRDTEFILKTISSSNEFQDLLENDPLTGEGEGGLKLDADNLLRKVYVDSMGYYENIMVVDKGMDKVADSLSRDGSSIEIQDTDFIEEAIEKDSMVVSNMYFSDVSQTSVEVPLVSMAYPVKHQTGEVLGALILTFDFRNFSSEVTDSEISENGDSYILGRSGDYLTGSSTGEIQEKADDKLNSEILERVNIKSENLGYNTILLDDGDWSYFYSAIPNTSWIVVFSMPESDYLTVASEIRGNTIAIVILGAFVALIIGSIFVSKQVSNIKSMAKNMEDISEGDFTVSASSSSKDEFMDLSNSINNMVGKQNGVLKKIIDTATRLKDASEDMKEKSNYAEDYTRQIALVSEELLRNAEENSTSIENINRMVEEIQEDAQSTENKSEVAVKEGEKVQEYAEDGLKAVERASISMENIEKTIVHNIEEVKALVESSERIHKFIGYIKEISKKTNLLALNASIEAARAGEAGRGFNVVAEEIRELSKNSDDASGEIERVLESIVHDINKVDGDMESTRDSFEESKISTENVRLSFDNIYNSVYELNNSIGDSSEAARRQRESIEYISLQVKEIEERVKYTSENAKKLDNGTDQQEEAMEDIIRVASRLDNMSDEMMEAHSKFIVTNN